MAVGSDGRRGVVPTDLTNGGGGANDARRRAESFARVRSSNLGGRPIICGRTPGLAPCRHAPPVPSPLFRRAALAPPVHPPPRFRRSPGPRMPRGARSCWSRDPPPCFLHVALPLPPLLPLRSPGSDRCASRAAAAGRRLHAFSQPVPGRGQAPHAHAPRATRRRILLPGGGRVVGRSSAAC